MPPTQWTLRVEGLGKIERAEVRVHPMILLVGENNSGKSYLATLLWGLLTLGEDFLLGSADSAEFQACDQWLQGILADRTTGKTHVMDGPQVERLIAWFNAALRARQTEILFRFFNDRSISADRIEIRAWIGPPIEIEVKRLILLIRHHFTCTFEIPTGESDVADRHQRRVILIWLIHQMILYPFQAREQDILGKVQPVYATFLPASRTGFLLMFKTAVRELIGQWSKADQSPSRDLDLTLPAIRFLQSLATGPQAGGAFAEIADFLEQEAFGTGRIEVKSQGSINEFQFRVDAKTPPLPMSLASAAVTELTPIVLFLRNATFSRVLILEEPEAHLHPRLQRVLARALVRLVRAGVYVWITTHSEDFCQQINNLIKIGADSNRSEIQNQLGYQASDYLLPEEADGYQFVLNDAQRTVVKALDRSSYGIAMPTFNHELMQLQDETLLLNRRIADQETQTP